MWGHPGTTEVMVEGGIKRPLPGDFVVLVELARGRTAGIAQQDVRPSEGPVDRLDQ
jgi:hypothetical protein